MSNKLYAVVEMPRDSTYKYEMDTLTGTLVLDRVLQVPVPYNYGYITGTLAGDDDPLDVFIVSDHPIPPLTLVEIEVLGGFDGDDNGDADAKIIAKIKGDEPRFSGAEFAIRRYLETYKEGYKVKDEALSVDDALDLIELSTDADGM